MNGGSSQTPVTQQTTQTRDPWGPSQEFLKEAMANAQGLFHGDTGYQPYSGQTQADPSIYTTAAREGTLQGLSNPLLGASNQAALDFTNQMLTNRGMTPDMLSLAQSMQQQGADARYYAQESLNRYGDIYNNAAQLAQQPAQQYGDIYNAFGQAMQNPLAKYEQQYGDVGNYAADTRSRYQTLYDEAAGNQNPYLQSILDTNNRRIGDRINASMSGAGRYGSGQHTDVMARALAESADPILAQDYQNRQQQKMAATAAMADAYNQLAAQRQGITTGIGNISNMGLQGQLGATQGLNNVYNNMLAQQQGATQGIGNTYNTLFNQREGVNKDEATLFNQGLDRVAQWGGMLPQVSQQQFQPQQMLGQIGAGVDARNQALLNDQINLYNAQQARPWEQVNRYLAAVQGVGGLGGSTVTATPVGYQPSTVQRVLGGGLAGAGLGSAFGPIGTGVGAVGGGLLGLF